MWTAGYKYSWKKMEAAARNRAEAGEEWSVAAYVPPGVINETQVKLFSNKSQ